MSRLANAIWLTVALACGTALAADGIRWAPDIATGRKAAAQYEVPLLIHFYRDDCLPCKILDTRVYSQQRLVDTLNEYFICVRVNASNNRQIAAEYQVHSLPTDVFVSPDGKTLQQDVCPQTLSAYMGVLQNVKVMNRDRNIILASKPSLESPMQQPYVGRVAQNSPAQPTTLGASKFGAPARSAIASAGGLTQSTPSPTSPRQASTKATGFQAQSPAYYPTSPGPAGPGQASPQIAQFAPLPHNVSRGPSMANNQPQAIVGAVQGNRQQLAPPAARAPNIVHPGQLPKPREMVAQISGPAARTANALNHGNLPGMPSVPAPTIAASTTTNDRPKFQVAAAQVGKVNALLVSNPYFTSQQQADAEGSSTKANATNHTDDHTDEPGTMPSVQPKTQAQTTSPISATKPAIDGYCPIALKTNGEWIAGDAKYAVKHRGKVYWLSGQAAVGQFLQDPDASSPVLSGFDPIVFLDEGKLVEGSTQYGLREEVSGSFVLFSSAEAKQRYEADFDRYAIALNAVLEKARAE